MIDVIRFILDLLYLDWEEVANVNNLYKFGEVNLVIIDHHFFKEHFLDFEGLSFIDLVSDVIILRDRQ